jgi:hypothetical protein
MLNSAAKCADRARIIRPSGKARKCSSQIVRSFFFFFSSVPISLLVHRHPHLIEGREEKRREGLNSPEWRGRKEEEKKLQKY